MADIIIRALPLRRPLRASLTHDDALQIQVVDDVKGAEDRKIPISIICVDFALPRHIRSEITAIVHSIRRPSRWKGRAHKI
jgi:hypothetical protein